MSDEEELIADFRLKYVMLYDGSPRYIGPSRCMLTNIHMIIDGAGGTHRISVREISGVRLPESAQLSKSINVEVRGAVYQFDCRDWNQVKAVMNAIHVAMRKSR